MTFDITCDYFPGHRVTPPPIDAETMAEVIQRIAGAPLAPPTTATRKGRPHEYVPRRRHASNYSPAWHRTAYRPTIGTSFAAMTPRERLIARAMYRKMREETSLFCARAAVFGVCVALISVRP